MSWCGASRRFLAQREPLLDAEPMLLVHDGEAQFVKLDVLLN